MDILASLREALSNLLSSKLRSFLAILGILVGTGSVVALITTGELGTDHAISQFKTLGTNLLSVTIESPRSQGDQDEVAAQLNLNDLSLIAKRVPAISRIAPYINLSQTTYFSGKKFFTAVLGATEALEDVGKIHLAKGRFVSELDEANFYCVIGAKLAKKLKQLGAIELIGNQLLLGKWLFTIIGIAKPWKPNLFIYADVDNGVIIPLKAAYLMSKYAKINNLLIRLKSPAFLKTAQNQVGKQLSLMLPGIKVNFRNPLQIIGIMTKQEATFTWLLGAIGGISLLVGGIGVMNIMLVSVVERRREIGIRQAIGANQRDILIMFLIESVILTLFGGILGIIVGELIAFVIAEFSGWAFVFYFFPPLLGFSVSILVGVLSGFYPALRASRLDPIQTLRSE